MSEEIRDIEEELRKLRKDIAYVIRKAGDMVGKESHTVILHTLLDDLGEIGKALPPCQKKT